MTINVKIDLSDIASTVEGIETVLKMEANYGEADPDTEQYCTQLRGFLYSARDALEEEILRYDDISYEAFEINGVISKIKEAIHECC